MPDELNRLAIELELYRRRRSEWLQDHVGQYVVAKEENVLGFYPDFGAAYSAGAEAFGPHTDFLVKQVLEFDPVFEVY